MLAAGTIAILIVGTGTARADKGTVFPQPGLGPVQLMSAAFHLGAQVAHTVFRHFAADIPYPVAVSFGPRKNRAAQQVPDLISVHLGSPPSAMLYWLSIPHRQTGCKRFAQKIPHAFGKRAGSSGRLLFFGSGLPGLFCVLFCREFLKLRQGLIFPGTPKNNTAAPSRWYPNAAGPLFYVFCLYFNGVCTSARMRRRYSRVCSVLRRMISSCRFCSVVRFSSSASSSALP